MFHISLHISSTCSPSSCSCGYFLSHRILEMKRSLCFSELKKEEKLLLLCLAQWKTYQKCSMQTHLSKKIYSDYLSYIISYGLPNLLTCPVTTETTGQERQRTIFLSLFPSPWLCWELISSSKPIILSPVLSSPIHSIDSFLKCFLNL